MNFRLRYPYIFSIIFALLFLGIRSNAQVVVTSSDSIDCQHTCTTLTATLIGDVPIDAGITTDDEYSGGVQPIGFTFNFYGTDYTQCLIGPNGNISFNISQTGGYDPYPIQAPLLGNNSVLNCICGPWCDIDFHDFGGTCTYATDGVAPNRKFVVTFCRDFMYNNNTCPGQYTTTQIIMYETTNLIEVHIAHKTICTQWNGGYAIVGVQNANGTLATVAPGRDYPTTWAATDEGWRFTPQLVNNVVIYNVASIQYAPVPFANSVIYWFNATTNTFIDTGLSIQVCPTSATTYKAGALGCADTSFGFFHVTVLPQFNVTSTATNATNCVLCDGTITIKGMNPFTIDTFTYQMNGVTNTIIATAGVDSSVTLTNLCPGTYNVSVKMSYCTATTSQIIIGSPPPQISGVTTTNPNRCDSCNGTISIHGLQPFKADTIMYMDNGVAGPTVIDSIGSDSIATLKYLCVGTYTNIIIKSGICIYDPIGPITLTQIPQSVNSMAFTNPTYCGYTDGTITLHGGLFTGLTDTLTYTFQDVNGNVTQHTGIYVIGVDSTIVMADLAAGTYYNIIIKSGLCVTVSYGPIILADPALIVTSIVATDPSACGVCDGTIKLTGLPPNQFDTVRYTLNGVKQPYFIFPVSLDKTITMVNLCPGIYDSFVVANNALSHCISNMTGPVTVGLPGITPGFTFNIHRGCPRDTVYFTNTATPADMEVRWRFGNGVTDTLPNPVYVYDTQGVYTVTQIVSNLTCTDSVSQTVDVTHPIKAAFTVSPDTLCQGGTVTFTNNSIGGTPVYYWSFGDGSKIDSIDLSPAHTYFNPGIYHALLLERDAIPCTDTAGIDINVDPVSGISISQTDTALCAGQAITFRADYNKTGNTGYTWNFGDGNSVANESPVIHTYDVAGMYTVSVAATYRACPDTAGRVTVDVHPYPAINLGPDTSMCPGSGAITLADIINAGNTSARWLWNTGETASHISVSKPGYYYSTVTLDGCSNTDSVWVKNDCYIGIPNVFTPDGDGLNDYFFPSDLLTRGATSFKMDIYNRWGQMIFETTATNGRGWDGRFNNTLQPEGAYVYIIDVTFKDGKSEHHQGTVTLIR